MTKAEKVLEELLRWSGPSETDLYPYIRDFFVNVLGYPKDHIRLTAKETQGKIPDVSVVSADAKPKDGVYWLVGEVKDDRGLFRSAKSRVKVWEDQLKKYVTADTVYALLIDPVTIVVLRPNGSEVKTVELDKHSVDELLSPEPQCSMDNLSFKNSVCESSLSIFKEGVSPSRYLDVTLEEDRGKFYEALRVSARELIDFSLTRLNTLQDEYAKYQAESAALVTKVGTLKDAQTEAAKKSLQQKYAEAIQLFEVDLRTFEAQIGRELPKKEDEARKFLLNLYTTEGASLVLARILFVRFLEDHDMTSRKISNGGIKAFREYQRNIRDDYLFLLTNAFKEAERLYRRLFEPSIFDWSNKGDGQLSRLLLRIFYRLNAFEFTKITGDILGNLYERFLDVGKRKKLGEYYTPMYVARYVVERIGFYDSPGALLDPACGSGTFLIAAAVGLIDRLLEKGVKLDVAIRQAVDQVHGLDVNMFAAFIAQLQLIWHLLPYLKKANVAELPEFKIYGGGSSLTYSNQQTLTAALLSIPTAVPAKVRDSKFRYVVGNPPYIRNERLKDKGLWRQNYDIVDFHNSDIAYYFVARAIEGKKDDSGVVMPSWLEDGGRMCFVLPMGLLDSRAASRIRDTLMQYNVFEITDLEDIAIHIFPSPQASGRATVAPVLVFAEKTAVPDSATVRLVQVAENAAKLQRIDKSSTTTGKVPKRLFRQSAINPYGAFLPKVHTEDVPVLDTLMNHPKLKEFTVEPTPTYGVGVAKSAALKNKPASGLLPLGKGLNVSVFRVNPRVSSWVDLSEVRSPSIWRGKLPEHAYALSTICLSLQCSMFDPSKLTLNASTLIVVPREEYSDVPWDLLLNSSPVRFVHLQVLRTALVGVGTPIGNGRRAAWCTVYPRTASAIPVPKKLLENGKTLREQAEKLRGLAETIASRWVAVATCLKDSGSKPLALHDVDFSHWQSDIEEPVEFKLSKEPKDGMYALTPYAEEKQPTFLQIRGSYELLNVVKYLLDERESETLTARELQDMKVPEDPREMSKLLDTARDPNSAEIREFKKVFGQADDVIASAYGLNKAQWEYVKDRLSKPPFDVLEPRWPWKAVKMREIQAYDVDRFA